MISIDVKGRYRNSEFCKKMENIMDTIEFKLTNVRRIQRLSCHQLLEVMNDWTIDTEVITSHEKIEYFINKFKANDCKYFLDTLEPIISLF